MTPDEITDTLQRWMTDRAGAEVDPQVRYADMPEIDSFDVLQLITFAETTWGVRFSAADFEAAGFGTLAGLARAIHAKL